MTQKSPSRGGCTSPFLLRLTVQTWKAHAFWGADYTAPLGAGEHFPLPQRLKAALNLSVFFLKGVGFHVSARKEATETSDREDVEVTLECSACPAPSASLASNSIEVRQSLCRVEL